MRKIFADVRRRRQQGLTLIETAMVLAIAALVVAGVMLFFQNANDAQKTNDAMNQLAVVQQVTRSLFAGQPDYTGLTDSILAASKQLPNRMIKGSTLQSAFNGAITVIPANSNANFSVAFASLPVDACSKMATMDLGSGLYSIEVDSAAAVNAAITGRTLTPSEANTNCGTDNGATITWIFY